MWQSLRSHFFVAVLTSMKAPIRLEIWVFSWQPKPILYSMSAIRFTSSIFYLSSSLLFISNACTSIRMSSKAKPFSFFFLTKILKLSLKFFDVIASNISLISSFEGRPVT